MLGKLSAAVCAAALLVSVPAVAQAPAKEDLKAVADGMTLKPQPGRAEVKPHAPTWCDVIVRPAARGRRARSSD